MDQRNGQEGGEMQDTVTFEDSSLSTLPKPPEISPYAKQVYKLTNIAASSALVSLLRVFTNPPTPPVPQNAEALPPWYMEEFNKKTKYQLMAKQYVRDTVLLTAASYVMEGVENGIRSIRGGVDDQFNKMVGGITAGGMVGVAWFPGKHVPQAILGATGAVVGLISYRMTKAGQAMLLQQQQNLEREVFGKTDSQLRKEVDTDYLRQLIQLRQKQLAEAAEHLRHKHQGNGEQLSNWVSKTGQTTGSLPAPGPESRGFAGRWAETTGSRIEGGLQDSQQQVSDQEPQWRDDVPQESTTDSVGHDRQSNVSDSGQARHGGGRGLFGFMRGDASHNRQHQSQSHQRQNAPAGPVSMQPNEMQIREESDIGAEGERVQARNDPASAMFIKEDEDAPR